MKAMLSSTLLVFFLIAPTVALAQPQRATLGLRLDSAGLPELLREHLDIADEQGVLVDNVMVASPAAEAGFEPGDILLAVDGVAMKSVQQLIEEIGAHQPGDIVLIERLHKGERETLNIALAAPPAELAWVYLDEEEAGHFLSKGSLQPGLSPFQGLFPAPGQWMPNMPQQGARVFRSTSMNNGDVVDITIEGDPSSSTAKVIVEANGNHYETQADALEVLPLELQEKVKEALSQAANGGFGAPGELFEQLHRQQLEQMHQWFNRVPQPHIKPTAQPIRS